MNWGSFGVPFVAVSPPLGGTKRLLLRSVNRWREWGCLNLGIVHVAGGEGRGTGQLTIHWIRSIQLMDRNQLNSPLSANSESTQRSQGDQLRLPLGHSADGSGTAGTPPRRLSA